MCASLRLSILPGVTLPRLYDEQVRDLNGDQQNDLLVGNSLTTNKVYINPGSGDFGSVVPFNVGSNTDDTRSIVIEAFDTQTAIIVGNAGQKNQLYFVPTVMTSFPSIQGEDIGTESDDTRSIAVGDVNSDTYTDIIATNAGMPPKMYLNPGGSNDFSEVTPEVAGATGVQKPNNAKIPLVLTDVKTVSSENPLLDIVTGTVVYRNTPSGLQETTTSIGMEPQTFMSIESKDINGDNLPDIVAAFEQNPTTPLRQSGIKVGRTPTCIGAAEGRERLRAASQQQARGAPR